MNIFSPGSLTARLSRAENPNAGLTLNQQWFFMRRNNTDFNEVSMNAKYHAGNVFNESSLLPLYSFNTTVITEVSQVMDRCFIITVDNNLLMSGEQVFIHYEIDDLDESGSGVRDDVALDFSAVFQQSDECEQISLPESDISTTTSSMPVSISVSYTTSASSMITTSDPATSSQSIISVTGVKTDLTGTPTKTATISVQLPQETMAPEESMAPNDAMLTKANIATALGSLVILVILNFL